MPEIVGDAALVVNPYDDNAICDAMVTIYEDRQLRQSLINKGLQRAEFFTWDKTAELIWNIIQKYMK